MQNMLFPTFNGLHNGGDSPPVGDRMINVNEGDLYIGRVETDSNIENENTPGVFAWTKCETPIVPAEMLIRSDVMSPRYSR
jgi:hypothetical protein